VEGGRGGGRGVRDTCGRGRPDISSLSLKLSLVFFNDVIFILSNKGQAPLIQRKPSTGNIMYHIKNPVSGNVFIL
jgi:hypothetical protein